MLRFIFIVLVFLIIYSIYSVFKFIFRIMADRSDYKSNNKNIAEDSDTIELNKDQYKVD